MVNCTCMVAMSSTLRLYLASPATACQPMLNSQDRVEGWIEQAAMSFWLRVCDLKAGIWGSVRVPDRWCWCFVVLLQCLLSILALRPAASLR